MHSSDSTYRSMHQKSSSAADPSRNPKENLSAWLLIALVPDPEPSLISLPALLVSLLPFPLRYPFVPAFSPSSRASAQMMPREMEVWVTRKSHKASSTLRHAMKANSETVPPEVTWLAFSSAEWTACYVK